jgi:hypothetical protein
MIYTVNHYDSTGTEIVRTSQHRTRKLAVAACKRAAKAGRIAAVAHTRTASDQPTVHH